MKHELEVKLMASLDGELSRAEAGDALLGRALHADAFEPGVEDHVDVIDLVADALEDVAARDDALASEWPDPLELGLGQHREQRA